GITVHLREDRRHIQERDVRIMKQTLQTRMNLEMAVTEEMIEFALSVQPEHVCLVPEKRQELTTEGGLDVAGQFERVSDAVTRLAAAGIGVSLFIDAEPSQIEASHRAGAPVIEIHTGAFADADNQTAQLAELARIKDGVALGNRLGLTVNAGHGLHYHNVEIIAAIGGINELNIGHGIMARAILSGLGEAVREMKRLMLQAAP
ncbi:MAG: pyridoxine 5'-phosphate synthase, partial [Pseudomonadales bacterium]|nr:pyridoxine 5'-phosphate synthase [Pseudomonadales bacterium]